LTIVFTVKPLYKDKIPVYIKKTEIHNSWQVPCIAQNAVLLPTYLAEAHKEIGSAAREPSAAQLRRKTKYFC